MRLWHKDLIPVLPRKQLVSQWRECCLIAKNINEKGTPNHLLVNKILRYPIEHFIEYASIIADEMLNRKYNCNWSAFAKYIKIKPNWQYRLPSHEKLFEYWHTKRYLTQCYFNLQEKYDCGGLTQEEWDKIYRVVHGITREDFWYVCEENEVKR